MLRNIGGLLVSCLRASDIAARVGDDEFVVLLPDTTVEHAQIVIKKIRARLTKASEAPAFSVTVSIGAASYSQAPTDIAEMMKAADDLMC